MSVVISAHLAHHGLGLLVAGESMGLPIPGHRQIGAVIGVPRRSSSQAAFRRLSGHDVSVAAITALLGLVQRRRSLRLAGRETARPPIA